MGIYQDKLTKIIDSAKNTTKTNVNQTAKENDVKWFYPLLENLQARNKNGEMILHPSMQKLYETAVQFDSEHEKFVLSSPTGSGKSGVIYYLCTEWFRQNKKHNVFHLINPLNVLNDQTTYDLIFVLKKFIKNNKFKEKDFAIYLNRCDGDSAGKTLSNKENICVYSFRDYGKKPKKKFELVISCVPSVKNTENKWAKEDCLTVIDEVHTIKYDDGIEIDEDSLKVSWSKFWNCVQLYSAYIRGITATVTEEMFKRIFGSCAENMYKVSFNEALASGRIVMACPIFTQYIGEFSLQKICEDQKQVALRKHLGIENHKILFSCSTNEEIANLIINNDYEGIFYISTTHFGKIKARRTNGIITILEKDMTIPEFSNSIETLEEGCIVFHIRQLIAGVNVKGLTGCVLQILEPKNDCITTQQTIGRCLRKKGTKSGGIVTFLLKNENADPNFYASKLKAIGDLMDAMYGENWIAASVPKKKAKPAAGNGNQPTPPSNNTHQIPVNMNTYYMEVETSVKECKKRYELGVKLNNENLKNASMEHANEVLNKYASTAVYGCQKERYIQAKQKLVIECDWEPFAVYGDWVEL